MKKMSVKEALDQVLAEMSAMTPAELRVELDAHKNGSIAQALREAQQFVYAAYNAGELVFEVGDGVVFCGDIFAVTANYGSFGSVSDMLDRMALSRHYWTFEGEPTRYATREELAPLVARGWHRAIEAMRKLEIREGLRLPANLT